MRFAAEQGYEHPVVFVDRTACAKLNVIDKRLDAQFSTQVGVCFEGTFDGSAHTILCNHDTPERLARALGASTETGSSRGTAVKGTAQKTLTIFSKFLKEKYRSLLQQFPELRQVQLRTEFWHRSYSCYDLEGIDKHGEEQSASLFLNAFSETEQYAEVELHDSSEASLYKKLKDSSWLENTLRQQLRKDDLSPAPIEKLPAIFSERAFAKLCAYFLRGFHADAVLQGHSFLNTASLPMGIHFSVLESPIEGDWDHEGSERRAVTLLDRGTPRALVSNRRHAELLAIPTTGHGRRHNYRSPPQIAFWSPEIIGHAAVDNLLQGREKALYIEDVDVNESTSIAGQARLEICQSFLVREGRLGEALAPFSFDTNLLNLLEKLECFSRKTKAHAQRSTASPWLTHIRTPAAFAPELDFSLATAPSPV